jgi:hypothetical protein
LFLKAQKNSILESQMPKSTGGFMKKTAYLTRATKRFLEGTNCNSPIQVVERSIKTLGDWIDTLSLEQEIEMAQLESSRARNKTIKNPRSIQGAF